MHPDPATDPFGLRNPHRGGCLICQGWKRVVTVPDDGEPGYFLIRICDTCDTGPQPVNSPEGEPQ